MMDHPTFRHFMEGIFNPFFIGLVIFFILIYRLCIHGNSRGVRVGFIILFSVILLASNQWFPKLMVHMLARQYPVINKINPEIKWIVVLAGGQQDSFDDAPANIVLSSWSSERVLEGIRLYHQLPKATLLLSGGAGVDKKHSEAVNMARLAKLLSIPEAHLVLEFGATNTASQALAVKSIVHQERFYLVTSGQHMPRSMGLFQKQGLNPIAAPSSYPLHVISDNIVLTTIPSLSNLCKIQSVWHEMMGWVWGMMSNTI